MPADHGRPVVLIAAALGVKGEVFREAFSHVHPAGPRRGSPTEAEARANKQALMSRLARNIEGVVERVAPRALRRVLAKNAPPDAPHSKAPRSARDIH